MKKTNKLLIMLSVLLIVILAPLRSYALGNGTDEINYLTDNDKAKVERFIEKQMDKGKIPGMSVVIVKGDKTVYQKGFGYSDIESEKSVNSKSLFEIGSNSKAFTALGILNLQKGGLINLNDEVTKYIPWLKVKYEGKEITITIEELLHHTSGIPFKTIDKIPVSSADNAIVETVKTLTNIELDSKPGEKFQYATINYDVLGLVIEKITGASYEKYIEENVLKPMGLNNTYLYRNENNNEDIAKGYKLGFLKPRLYDAPAYSGNKPAGYIISSAQDMAKWLKIQMGTLEGSKFSKDLIGDSHKPNRRVAPLGDGASYADGWFIYQKGGGEISHGGNNPNYSSSIVFRPEDKIGIAVLSNINSEYVSAITQGINEILQGKEYNKDIKDLNKSADNISVLIICIASLIIISTLYFMFITLKQILKKERKLNRIGIKNIFKIMFSFIFIVGLSYCVYLIPFILYSEVSWGFVFVWLPKSLKIALYFVYISIWLVFIYSLIISSYKKKKDKPILILSILSVVSGFGNALIIFTINMAIYSSNDMKVKLLVYFVLGIILYVYGQKIIRGKLIEVTNGIVYSKRMEIVKCLLRAPYNEFEEIEKGRIESTLNNDTETISRFANILISGVTSAITLICCFMYLGFLNKYALLLSVTVILPIASIYYLVGKYANKIGEESRDIQNIFFKFINDLIGGFKELSLNGKRKNEFEVDMEKSCDKYRVKRGQSALAFATMFVIGELLFTLAIGAVALIFPLILKNLEATSVASYVFILLYMTGPVHGILDTIPNAIEVKISYKRINDLLNQISLSNHKYSDDKHLEVEDNISLKLNEIEYAYDKNDEKSFKVGPIDYEFKSGEIVFITGGNGSGKSTLAKLITGLYAPSKGYVTLNNNKISEKMLSENYSTVFSDFYLFDKLYGIDYKSKEEDIEIYLEILQLNNKVQIEDGKFSTTKLSTGQKKRLALLITYLEDRPIYLFDEWAADQDPEFRMFFYNTLLPELKERGKCVIAITHDEHYFDIADKVIKMDMGRIQNI
ncbi:cyclic peptide export ABC transporter [Clostridium tagluense]|uniref:cyclic peptide export ABC transporter n=1 Tax=Clostridium tagluense TaxID=360422 RepID=UPI001CF4DC03|nr:cyclic peptide export ABC transporter [Clostridium tagluense]MCB2311587.1 cyclic peptide export ABC transporter [Clostridium tagluense]MCB2316311.1 cyclic peptide export ABC transporter [Clostridium tagluense]MCB2321166.1 cyclic peptide export ABC transporter [Clostridium tagluense]MCB2326180.1 cyclic peptide export ABC transporter [Clostridium tagluense]MCB2330903.1 cyclic peptide export ABC transporter [Clostridium tagluense]